MNDKKGFCCQEMYSHLFRSDKNTSEFHFDYYPRFREYFIDYKKVYGGGIQLVNYCHWCGNKLPNSLRDKFFDILEKEITLKLISENIEQTSKFPQNLRVMNGWKKRGL